MVPNLEARKVLDLAQELGVEIIMLDFEVDLSYKWQNKIEAAHGASRCPAEWPCYASFGNAEAGTLGKLLIPSRTVLGYWEWEGGILPEILLLHELAHCVVGTEARTIPWEQAQCERLWGRHSPQWTSLELYELGAVDGHEIVTARQDLTRLGFI